MYAHILFLPLSSRSNIITINLTGTALCGVLATSVKTGCRVLNNHMVGICHMLVRDPGLLYRRDGAEDMIG